LKTFVFLVSLAWMAQPSAQIPACIEAAADVPELVACVDREVLPLSDKYALAVGRYLSSVKDPELRRRFEHISNSRERWRHNTCMAMGEMRALRTETPSQLERLKGVAVCQRRILEQLLGHFAECEQTPSSCEWAMMVLPEYE